MAETITLPKELSLIAHHELNEEPTRVKEDIAYIRSWLTKQLHIKARTDDYTILLFLRSCKFSLEKTKRKIDSFYSVKAAFPDLFKNRDPFQPVIQYVFKENLILVLPNPLTEEVILMLRFGRSDPNVLSINDGVKIAFLTLDVILRKYVKSSVVGVTLLVDLKNTSTKYLTQLTPFLLKKFITCLENAYPLRIKAFHLTNLPTLFVSILNILKTLSSKKMQNRIICQTLDEQNNASDYFPASVLPSEYGGKAGSLKSLSEKLKNDIESFRDWLLEDEQYGSTEERSLILSKLEVDSFSLEGSFRKLEID